MTKLLLIGITTIVFSGVAPGQKGTAEPGFYPSGYAGDIWTGIVTAVNEDTREFTLTYKKKDKEQTFVGILPKTYTHKMKDGTQRGVKLADLMGMKLRVYYISKSKKIDDQKIKYNEGFDVKILAMPNP